MWLPSDARVALLTAIQQLLNSYSTAIHSYLIWLATLVTEARRLRNFGWQPAMTGTVDKLGEGKAHHLKLASIFTILATVFDRTLLLPFVQFSVFTWIARFCVIASCGTTRASFQACQHVFVHMVTSILYGTMVHVHDDSKPKFVASTCMYILLLHTNNCPSVKRT